ncbi:MAG TPA: CotH kinase family protein [Chitinispirillaceae bacterium]|nr:CotH kinase family protein [Chitinispirillaceae bacterium]
MCVYPAKRKIDYTDLTNLIEETLRLREEEFSEQVNDVVCVNNMLVYFAVMAIIQNHDHLRKDYYLYRDPESKDYRWTIVPWDLELTFSHLWTQAFDVLEEDIFTEEPLDFGANGSPLNTLFSRLYATPAYREHFDAMVEHLLTSVFTLAFVNERIDNFLCRATLDIFADRNKRATSILTE